MHLIGAKPNVLAHGIRGLVRVEINLFLWQVTKEIIKITQNLFLKFRLSLESAHNRAKDKNERHFFHTVAIV